MGPQLRGLLPSSGRILHRLLLSLFIASALSFGSIASAQKIGGDNVPSTTYRLSTAAILPIAYFKDDDALPIEDHKESQDMFRDSLKALIEHYGIKQADQASTNSAYAQTVGQPYVTDRYTDLPKPEDLVRMGKHLGVDLVIVPRCRWHVKSIVTITGLKTKASAKVDLWIIDVRQSQFDLHANAISADDTEADNALKIAAAILVAPVAVFISGGAEAPHLQRAGVAGLIKAIKPWTEKQDNAKIN